MFPTPVRQATAGKRSFAIANTILGDRYVTSHSKTCYSHNGYDKEGFSAEM